MQHRPERGWIYGLLVWVSFLALLVLPERAQAGAINVSVNAAKPDFPRSIAFHITAKADSNIDRVALIYGVNTETCLSSQARHEMVFDPKAAVDLEWEWDMFRSGDLPPGVEIWWQWEIHAADGTQQLTDVMQLTVEDPGYEWKKLERGQITLYWAKGSNAFGQSLLDIAASSLDRLASTSGLKPSGSIRLTIYPSQEAMKNAMMHTTDWMGGVAFPEYRIVLLEIAPETDMAWPKSAIPHELSHLVFGQRIYNCLSMDAPSWLNEGMARYAEGPVTEDERKPVLDELKQNRLQPFTSIAAGFPADSRRANLAYSQSKLLVDFMIESYGKDKLEALLDQFKDGQKTDDALRAVYGLDTNGLDLTWRASLGFGTAPEPSFATPTAAVRSTVAPTLALMQAVQPTASSTATTLPTATAAPSATPAAAGQVDVTAPPTVVAAAATAVPSGGPGGGLPSWLPVFLAGGAVVLLMVLGGAVILLRRKK